MADASRHDRTARQLRLLSDALDTGRLGPVRRLINTLSPAEIANLLESLPTPKRSLVWGLVDPEDDGEVLVHVGEDVRESLIAEMDPDELVAAVEDLDIDDLADIAEDLPDQVIEEVLRSMDRENRDRLEQVLTSLLTHEASTPINELIDDEQSAIAAGTGEREVANQFSDHDWVSAPVVDENNILLGRITIDDVVDIIREQAEHQALGAAGLGEDEDLFSPVGRAMRRRLVWLFVNLCTAFIAANVVGQFEGTIDKLVALAVLMPMVAGLGGNAGTQVLALTIRGLALGQVGASNVMILLWKELRVALFNGLLMGAVLGLIVLAWFRNVGLSMVISVALTANLLLAAVVGVTIPLLLKRMGFDPALGSGIFLTALTDSLGFFTFLGLATLLLLG